MIALTIETSIKLDHKKTLIFIIYYQIKNENYLKIKFNINETTNYRDYVIIFLSILYTVFWLM
jgi:hypothetical protein